MIVRSLGILWQRLRGAVRHQPLDAGFETEIGEHVRLLAERYRRQGMAPEPALLAARRQFGSIALLQEDRRAMQTMPAIEGLLHDVRFATRILRKSRGFTVVASTSLALAIGANTTIFSVAKQLLYERLAVSHAADLRLLTWTRGRDDAPSPDISYPVYEQLRAENQALGALAAFHVTAVNATIGVNAERVLIHEVSGNYDAVLGVQPQLGRAIAPMDDTAGSDTVAVISDGL